LLPSLAQAWWNDEWNFRKQLTVDGAAAQLNGGVSEAAILVRLHTGNFGYFHDIKPDGTDLRFIAGDDKSPLKYHIERFDPVNEMALIWVKLPVLAAGAKEQIWMYYGNPAANDGQDGAGSYDTAEGLVYHFTAQGAPRDLTAYGNQASRNSAAPEPVGLLGAGARFNGQAVIEIPASPSLQYGPDKGWSFSAWVKPESAQQNATIVQMGELNLAIKGLVPTVQYKGGRIDSPALSDGNWHLLALSLSKDGSHLYIDGAEAGSAAPLGNALNAPLVIGQGLVGVMDEVQIATTARSADWFRLAYHTQSADGNVVTAGNDEQNQGGGNSYFAVILKNVTVDGWVVIAVLAVMAMVSWLVMIGKGVVISRVRRDNRIFLDDFHKLGVQNGDKLDAEEGEDERELGDSPFLLALFGKHDHYQSSPMYRLYHVGVQELHNRFGRAAGAQATGLSSAAIDAIRASLDATLVRESQKLNNQMVLLTIAISGGPFLGLLGTVVGVMITFAAIAATGDVNINAIAPGIAAALVATVAGLAVAIPALFGYNYLSSRIRDISADMRVFVDEYLGRIAEHHGQ
jgi:biopolymer transport protein ExbB